MTSKRVLVIGATGFVGTNLARRLLRDGHEVHLLVRPNYQAWRIKEIQEHVHLHEVRLEDIDQTSNLITAIRPEWIFHLAAYGAYSSQMDLQQMIQTNIVCTANLVQACLKSGFEVFVNTGSSSEYGFKDFPPPETARLDPNSPYAITKAAATNLCQYTAQQTRMRIPTLRLYSVFGPYEEPTRLLPTVIRKGRTGELPPLVNPEVARDFIYVDDVCDAYLICAATTTTEYGSIYNVGTGIQTSVRDVVEIARRVFGIEQLPDWGSMPDRAWDTSTWISNPQKIMEELGWRPRFTFETGFKRMVEWFEYQQIPQYS